MPYVVDIVEALQAGQDEVETFVADLQLPTWLSTALTDALEQAEGVSGDAVSAAVGSVANVAGIVVLAVFLLYFFLRDGDKAWMWLFQTVGEDQRERITTVGDETLGRVGNYVRGTTVVATTVAVTSFIFMLLLGTPLALPLALLAFVAAFIPYFGGAIASLIIVLVTWGAIDSTAALIMAGLLLARFAFVQTLVRPRAYEQALSIQPALILIVLPIGLQVGGLAGLILAVPLAAVVVSVAQGITQSPGTGAVPDPACDRAGLARPCRAVELASAGRHRVRGAAGLDRGDAPAGDAPRHPGLDLRFDGPAPVRFRAAPRAARGISAAIAVGGATVAIVGVLAVTLVSLVDQAEELGDAATGGAAEINDAAGGILGLGTDAVASGSESAVQTILDASSQLAGLGVALILTVLLTFYFLRDGGRIWAGLMSHVAGGAASQLNAAGAKAFGVLGGYMVGTAAISFVGAASQAAIMWILGLPLVMPVFVLSFFGGFIPYIGSLLTTGLAFLIAVQVGTTVDVVVMGIWTLVFNIVQGNVVAPAVYNRTTSIHPAIVLACIPAASAVAGILGMFLVVPVLGVVLSTWRTILRVIGSDEPADTSPEVAEPDEVAAPQPG